MQQYVELLQKQMVKHVGFRYKSYNSRIPNIFSMGDMKGRIQDVQTWESFPRPESRNPGMSFKMGDLRPSFSKRYVRVYYGIGTLIPKEDWDTDQTGTLAKEIPSKAGAFAISQMTLREQVASEWWKLFAFAAEGNNTPGMSDGRPLLSTSHPISRSNSSTIWSNKPSTAADLGVASLQAGMTNIRKQKAPNNQQVIDGASGALKLLVAPDNIYTAQKLTQGKWEMGSANRDENFLVQDNILPVDWAYWGVQSAAGAAAGVVNGWTILGPNHGVNFLVGDEIDVESQYKLEVRSMLYVCTQSFAVGADYATGTYGSAGA